MNGKRTRADDPDRSVAGWARIILNGSAPGGPGDADTTSLEELGRMREESANSVVVAWDKGDEDTVRQHWNDLVVTCCGGDSSWGLQMVLAARDSLDFAAGRFDLFAGREDDST